MPQYNECLWDGSAAGPDVPYEEYAGGGGTGPFVIGFPYQHEDDVVVFIEAPTGTYTKLNGSNEGSPGFSFGINSSNENVITLTTSTSGQVHITRVTELCENEAEFEPGASVRAEDLNATFTQMRHAIIENREILRKMEGGGDIVDPPSVRLVAGDGIDIASTMTEQTISVDLASNPGLEFDSGELRVDAHQGLERTASGLSADLGDGLEFDGSNQIQVHDFNGILSDGNGTQVVAHHGINVDANGVSVDLNGTNPGLAVDANGLRTDGNQTNIGTVQFGSGDTYTFPTSDGSSNEVLTTDGSGNLSWTDKTQNTNTTYEISSVADSGNVNLRLTGSNPSSQDDVLMTAGTGVSFTSITANGFTINAGGGGADVDILENVAALNTAADGPPSDGDVFLLLDSTNLQAAAGSSPANEEAVNGLPETDADGQPIGGYGSTIQVTLSWDDGNTRWQFVRWAVQSPDNRYVLEQGDTMTGNLLFNDGTANTAINADGSAVFNENGDSVDFRVESSTQTHMLFVDGSENRVGIGTDSPVSDLHVDSTGGSTFVTIEAASDNFAGILFGDNNDQDIGQVLYNNTDNSMEFVVNTSERMRIDSAGRMLIGTDTARTAESNRLLQVESTNSSAGLSLTRNAQSVASATLGFIKTRGDQIGDNDIVEDNDQLGMIAFYGADGVDTNAQGARIFAFVDGTPASNEMPGCLSFQTNDGSANANPTERMRIRSDGNVSIGSSGTNFQRLSVYGTTGTGNGNTMEIIGARPEVSDAITNVILYNSRPTFNFTGTQTSVFHYLADPQSITSGTITNQYGFRVQSSLTGATNNYGFYSDIGNASSTNRWNFYAGGTAPNYFRGSVYKDMNGGGELVVAADPETYTNHDSNGISLGYSLFCTRTSATPLDINRGKTGDTTLDDSTNHQVMMIRYKGAQKAAIIVGTSGAELTGFTRVANPSMDGRVLTSPTEITNATDVIKQLAPKQEGFKAEELQAIVPEAVTGTQNATEAIGTLADYDGTVLQTEVPAPSAEELTYTEEVEVTPYVAPVKAVYSEPELITPGVEGKAAVFDDEGNELEPAVEYQEPVYSEPVLITPAVEEVQAVYETVTRTRTWTPSGTRPVYQGVDQTKLIPLLTKALQEALERIETLELNTNPEMSSISELTNKVNAIEAENSLVATLVQNISARLDSIDDAITALQNPSTPEPEVNLIPDEWSQDQRLAAMQELLNEYNSNK